MNIVIVSTSGDKYSTEDILGEGETSRVYRARKVTAAKSNIYAVKIAKEQRYNKYIQNEHDVLNSLHSVISHKSISGTLPLPTTEVGFVQTDNRQALIMQPVLTRAFWQEFRDKTDFVERQQLALHAAKQYVQLIQALVEGDKSCSDRKLSDLWWVTEQKQLVVTDWNVVDQSANPQADIRRFGLLWFELIIGYQKPKNYFPSLDNFNDVHAECSYGLWYLIGRCVGSKIGPLFSTIQELSTTIDILAQHYVLSQDNLVKNAKRNLQTAKDNLNQESAHFAYSQYDIAQRRDSNIPASEIEEAKKCAQNVIREAIPNLFREFRESDYNAILWKLENKKTQTHNSQEEGDIQRLLFGLSRYKIVQSGVEKAVDASPSVLTEARQNLEKTRSLLFGDIIGSLIRQKGTQVQDIVQTLKNIIALYVDLDEVSNYDTFVEEALFWESYNHAVKIVDTEPVSAVNYLQEAHDRRANIHYLPKEYQPSQHLLIEKLQSLKDEKRATELRTAKRSELQQYEIDSFKSSVQEDVEKHRWGVVVASFTTLLRRAPEHEELREIGQKLVELLIEQKNRLTLYRSLGNLRQCIEILQALLQLSEIPSLANTINKNDFELEIETISQIQEKILQAQNEFFRSPQEVLMRASSEGYEIFDTEKFSVATLRMLWNSGWLGKEQLKSEVSQLQAYAKDFEEATRVLKDRADSVRLLTPALGELQGRPLELNSKFTEKLLQLFLLTALSYLEHKNLEAADEPLERAGRLLQEISDPISQQFRKYDEYYKQLKLLHGMRINENVDLNRKFESSSLVASEDQISNLFYVREFDKCRELANRLSDSRREYWISTIGHAEKIQEIISVARELETYFPSQNFLQQLFGKQKKDKIFVYTHTLNVLDRIKQQLTIHKPIYKFFETDIQPVYVDIQNKLRNLDPGYRG